LAGLTTVTSPVTGTLISSTTFGIPVANDITVLANPPTAKLRNSVTQSITNNVAAGTAITWDTEDFDTAGGHSTVTNTSRYTCQAGYAGKYRLDATVWWAVNATGRRDIWFAVNGVTVAGTGGSVLPGQALIVPMSTVAIVPLVAGDFVEVFVFQNSGVALTTTIGGSTYQQSYFDVQWVSQ
jgi:hypothetical protein